MSFSFPGISSVVILEPWISCLLLIALLMQWEETQLMQMGMLSHVFSVWLEIPQQLWIQSLLALVGGTHISNNPSGHTDLCWIEADRAVSWVLTEAANSKSESPGVFVPALGLGDNCRRVTVFGSDYPSLRYTVVCIDKSFTLLTLCSAKLLC